MNQEPTDPFSDQNDQFFNQDDQPLPPDNSKRRKGLFSLTGLGARLAATALAIGLGVVILSYAMSSSSDETPAPIAEGTEPTVTVNVTPLATWTPGATSTPPPPANPTPEPEPAAPEEAAPADPNAPAEAGLASGSQVKVAGTEGFGVNMREGSGVTFAIVETIADETRLEIIGGPTEADGYTWWQARLEDGREGWVVQDFVVPAN